MDTVRNIALDAAVLARLRVAHWHLADHIALTQALAN